MYELSLGGLYIEITSFCNMKCPYCYNDSTAKGDYLPKEILFNVFEECKDKNVREISLSGGEPFAHPDIYEIVNKLDILNIKATIITNLSLIESSRVIEIMKKGHRFQLTLDHIEKEQNDIIRGKGSFDFVMNVLHNAKQERTSKQIVLRYNIGKNNVKHIENVVEIALKNNIKYLDFAILFKAGRAREYINVFDYTRDILDISELIKELANIKKKYEKEIAISYTELNKQRGCILFSEGVINLGAKIESNGNVHACQLFAGEDNTLGNVYVNSLSDILKSDKARSVIDEVKKRKNKQNDCAQCIFTEQCMCGCPAVSYNLMENMGYKDDQCRMIKFFLKEQIKKTIKENE